MGVSRVRRRFTRDGAWLRRARRHFCGLLRPWAELERDPMRFRERVWAIGAAMHTNGLLAPSCPHDAAYVVLSNWRRADRASFWPWMMAEKRRDVARMYAREAHNWAEFSKRKKVKRA